MGIPSHKVNHKKFYVRVVWKKHRFDSWVSKSDVQKNQAMTHQWDWYIAYIY